MSTARSRLMRRARRYLAIWMTNIGLDNGQGLTDINSDAEHFCCDLLNIILGTKLRNMNLLQMNFPAIDLADKNRRICVQVTSTADAEKITHTLDRFFAHGLEKDYDRLIVMILGSKKNYRTQFPQKEGFSFDPARDIWDIQKLLTQIAGLSMPLLEQVDAYLRKQFGDLEEQPPSMDLPVRSALDDHTFLGRDDELAEIARRFEQNEQLAILSGLGGMGKTELAVRFALTRWGGESYFVHFTKNWRQTVLENIAPRIRGLNRDGADTDRIYRDAMAELKSRGTDELLIIDNVDQEEASLTQLKRELSELRLRILITTRTDTAQKISVAQLQYEELEHLFELHESDVSPEEQRQLIDAVDGHTLTVDLMARALCPGRRAATADKLLQDLSDVTIRKVDTAYPGAPAQARIIEHLKVVFRVVELEEDEQELLRYATLLPDVGMDDSLFLAPIEADMEDALDHLIDNGWLIWKDDCLSIHPVIRKVCIEELEPSDENCGDYLKGLIKQYDEKDFRKDRYRQMAEMLTNASCCLADAKGVFANWAGALWNALGDFVQLLAFSLHALKKIEKNCLANDSALALALANHNLGAAYGKLGNHGKALEYQQKALVIFKQILPDDHPDLAVSYDSVGSTYGELGDHRKAIEYKRKALVIREEVLPDDHLSLAMSYNNVGRACGNLGDHRRALEYKQKALAIREKVLPSDHPDLAMSYNNVGCTYNNLGDRMKALEYQQKALAIREKVLPDDHPSLAESYNNVGYTYGALGNHRKALKYHQKALAIWERVLVDNHPHLATSCNNIALTYHDLGQLQDAAQYMRRAADIISRSSLPENHPDRVDYLYLADQFEKDAKMQQAMITQMQKRGTNPFDIRKPPIL